MSWSRREVLGGLGTATASLILGCHLPQRRAVTPIAPGDTVRGWLRDAVAWLAPTYPQVQALAVTRRRTTAAVDGLGAGVARSRFDGVVITVRDREGRREQVSSELTQVGVAGVVLALLGTTRTGAQLSFGGAPLIHAPQLAGDPRVLDDRALLKRVDGYATDGGSSRIIYAAGVLDIDDATTWSVAPDHDREQRLVRVRRIATRVAWNGTRPVVGEATLAWTGGIDDRALALEDHYRAMTAATELMTPGGFDEGVHDLLLDPSVAATALDALARALLTTEARRRPEVLRRAGALVAPMLTLVDDPAAPAAYGGFAFDDVGTLAAPVALIDRGRPLLGDGRELRPGHIGALASRYSHLRLEPGDGDPTRMLANGFALEGGTSAVVDPGSDRLVLAAARAREYKDGARTGRVFADVELVGSVAALLGSVTGLSKTARAIGLREDVDGEPTWRSIEAPWLACRGALRVRRRPA